MLSILDFLFPKRCVNCGRFGTYICKDCVSKIEYIEKPICPVCQRQAIGGRTHPGCLNRYSLDGLVVACSYRGPIKRAIAKLKYRRVSDLGETIVNLLSTNIWQFDFPNKAQLVPIPLHKTRKNWRGFNQADLLVQILAKKFKVGMTDLLVRIREGKTQVGLSKKDRRINVRDAFALRQDFDDELSRIAHGRLNISSIKGKDFILVDDVYTSGATMQEAGKVLKRAGAKSVWAMAVALG